jgi:tRNA pseudouridine38-40 synthase
MRTLKLLLQYDGTDYVGWQRQAQGRSVQGELEAALARIEGAPVTVVGAGRTDAGVHALGQVASLRLRHPIAPATLGRALNATLPPDVRVLAVEDAAPGFHARYGARAKTYAYRLWLGDVVPPFERRYAWHVPYRLDLDLLRAAARAFEGRHDFAAFGATGSAVAATERTIFSLVVAETPLAEFWHQPPGLERARGLLVTITVTGDGFLRHMVRTLVGTLVEVAAGRRDPANIVRALAARDRAAVGPTAPARGLFLVRVDYTAPERGGGAAGGADLEPTGAPQYHHRLSPLHGATGHPRVGSHRFC